MVADDNSAGGVDEQRRKILKLTLGSGVAFATPLMVSFSMDGVSFGSEAVAQSYTYDCPPSPHVGNATAQLDGVGNLLVTVSVVNCGGRSLLIVIDADVEVVYGCRNPAGRFPLGLGRSVGDTVSTSVEIIPESDSKTEVTLTLEPPELAESLRCPPSMDPGVAEVVYSNITGSIEGTGFPVVPNELSATF